jgi:dienelactone hydrolase
MTPFPTDDAHRFQFAHDGQSRPVFRDGVGPGVLLMHELPGMTPPCLRLAARIRDAGFTVYLPLFFGTPGRVNGPLQNAQALVCVRREFHGLSRHSSGPVTVWLRALCRRIREECGGPGVGAIGMCMTGGVVLALMVDDSVLAPVTCQPSLPLHQLTLPGSGARARQKAALGISPRDLAAARERSRTVPILGYRFETDETCPRERFATLRSEFGDGFRGTEFPTGPDSPGRVPHRAHSVLTGAFANFDDATHPTRRAFDEILAHFKEHLKA